MTCGEEKRVAIDASVLINLAILDRVELLGWIDDYRFVVPLDVLKEIERPRQRRRVDDALAADHLETYELTGTALLGRRTALLGQKKIGPGEAACLALAVEKGWLVACDEKGPFLRLALRLLGEGRLLNTIGLFLLGIRQGYWSVPDADQAKDILAENKHRMKLRTFQDLL